MQRDLKGPASFIKGGGMWGKRQTVKRRDGNGLTAEEEAAQRAPTAAEVEGREGNATIRWARCSWRDADFLYLTSH